MGPSFADCDGFQIYNLKRYLLHITPRVTEANSVPITNTALRLQPGPELQALPLRMPSRSPLSRHVVACASPFRSHWLFPYPPHMKLKTQDSPNPSQLPISQ